MCCVRIWSSETILKERLQCSIHCTILLTSAWCISELGANIAGAKEDEQESGVPSTNSIKSMNAYRNSASTELRSQIENIEEENVRYENKEFFIMFSKSISMPWSGQTKDYKIGICCFSAKHEALRRKSKDWLAQNQDNVSEWGDMSIRGLLFQWASTIKIQLSCWSSTMQTS